MGQSSQDNRVEFTSLAASRAGRDFRFQAMFLSLMHCTLVDILLLCCQWLVEGFVSLCAQARNRLPMEVNPSNLEKSR
jgi:hypothetical protein